jgi:hypothetical protein
MASVPNVVEMGRFATFHRLQRRPRPTRRVRSVPVAWQEVVEGARMREVVDALVRNRYRTELRGESWFVTATPAAYDAVAHEILWSCEGRVPAGAAGTAKIEGYNSIYQIELGALQPRGELYASVLPEQMMQVRSRKVRRVDAPEGATVSFSHPVWPEERVTRQMRDFSAEGVSFFSELEDVFHAGTVVQGVELTFPGHEPFVMDLTIRQIAAKDEDDRPFIGAEVKNADVRITAAWKQMAVKVLHPRIVRGLRHAGQIWDLYHRAGYFGLSDKVPEQFCKLRAPFERIVSGLERNPELGVHNAWTNAQGEVECTMAGLKTYRSSWLIFQLAKVSGNTSDGYTARQVLRDTNESVLEHAQQFDPNLRWFNVLLQVKKVWSRAAYMDVPRRLEREGKACIVRNHVLEVATAGWTPAVARDGLEIGEATQAEVMALATELENSRPVPYREGQDLTRWTMDLSAVKTAWTRAGFLRERRFLAARRDGKAVAVAVLETADEGMHLFRLLDNVRVFSLVEGGEQAFMSLVAASQSFFLERDRQAFVLYLEEDRAKPQAAELSGLTDLGLADLIIFSAEHMTEQIEFIHEVTAPRLND